VTATAAHAQLADLIAESDADGDGRVGRDEAPIEVLPNFSVIDQDGDGSIDSFEAWEYEARLRRERSRVAPTAPVAPQRAAPEADTKPAETLVELIQGRDLNGDDRLEESEVPESIRDGLRRLDPNRDGYLDLEEARELDAARAAREQGPSDAARAAPSRRSLARLVTFMDTDGDGLLQKREAPLRVQRVFEQVDRNRDGAIDAAEAAAADASGLWSPKR
jgi:hypothetical protein